MNENKLTHIVWDGDNTLWGWMDYAVPAYEAMCRLIARSSGKTEEETAAAMKAFYTERGTLEDAGLVQGLAAAGFFDHMAHFDQTQMVRNVQMVFSRERSANLKLYEGIQDVLEAVNGLGIEQQLLTDAPNAQARARLQHFNLGHMFTQRNAMPGRRPAGLPERRDRPWMSGSERIMRDEKPHTDLEAILNLTREQITEQVMIIGDNYPKDMGLAMFYGCRGIHAAYGLAAPDLVARIQKFAPESALRRNASTHPFAVEGAESRIVAVAQPRQILGFIRAT